MSIDLEPPAVEIDLTSQAFKRDPFPTLARMRDLGPVIRVRVPLFGKVWMATTYDAVNDLLRDHHRFVQSPATAGNRWMGAIVRWLPGSLKPLAGITVGCLYLPNGNPAPGPNPSGARAGRRRGVLRPLPSHAAQAMPARPAEARVNQPRCVSAQSWRLCRRASLSNGQCAPKSPSAATGSHRLSGRDGF